MSAHGGALFEVAGVEVTSAMTTTLGITVLVSGLVIAGTRNLSVETPGKTQNFIEYGVSALKDFYCGIMGEEKGKAFLPLLGSLFIFILVSNYSGLLPGAGILPGFQPPTGLISYTVALALVSFFATHISGFKYNGPGYLKHLFSPFIFMLPLNLIEEVVRPLSLSLRLFGNIYGEETVLHQVSALIPLGAPAVLLLLSVLFGAIQAIVFTMLTAIYINGATGHGH